MAYVINEEFTGWSGSISPDGIWRKSGVWYGTGNNEFDPARVTFTQTFPGETSTGFMGLTITPSTNPLQGGEIESLKEYGYGYYEVRMMPSDVSGGVASFFLVDFDSPWHEYDIEFLLNSHNQVTFSNYGGAGTTYYNLGFDPTADFHTYGILWEPGKVTDYVDGVALHSETNSYFVSDADGMNIMMNAWSGNPNWGGGPPATTSTSYYDWVHFTPLGSPPPPSAGMVSISDASISEGDSGTKVETFMVTRSGGTAAFDVGFATSNGSATTADSDYAAAAGTLHFGDNQNTQTISVTINGDTKVETNETFNVNLSNATNGATIGDGLGVGTIVNDDVAPPPPPPPPPGETIVGTSGNDVLVGTAGNDTIRGLEGNDTINGAGGADTLSGGKGHDLFGFHAGEADGDLILDFHSQGSSSDQLEFSGFGRGTFTQVDTTHWAIGYEGNSHPAEVIEILGTRVDLNDYHFLV
jgi:beta-glucanase (GH16 family)